ncbi:Outer membrane protein OmpA [Dyella jiangningensis]|uniref:OmpA family protein n=1 Tax=Dyella sp. AtDHG13 TaxID=1938897 RepID=UPI000883EA72|nr:OmpA family protein [Dyella sp. AtDHG13]PXV55328.1 outer membrane protein OmpA-like peptidoglycan-associated protein [Dyella sp. AtDHG13]SDK80635.1 Outer membrane protein OmpA [Dyella jiangningensis]
MRNDNTHARRLLCMLVAATVAMAGAVATSHAQTADAGPDFPDPSRATMPEGAFVNVENLRKLAPGMTKHQLYDLLGAPHFSEGVFGVHRWNYIFAFRETGGGVIKCQFQVAFDKNHLAQAYYWKPESCKDLLAPPAAPVAPAPNAAPMMAITLSSDAMFGFDSATLTPRGKANLDQLLSRVQEASRIQDIMITGYTDRIGSARYNQALSERRAGAVRDYLATHGVSPAAMRVTGRGDADPVVQCNDKRRDRLIACLAPNRRVELKGTAKASM